MIDRALTFLVGELNGYLQARFGTNPETLVLGRAVDDSGKWIGDNDQMRCALVNIEEERTVKSQIPDTVFVNGRNVQVQPDVKLNLVVVFIANFTTYEFGLTFLSRVIMFFQAHPSFTPDRYPALDPAIEKLSLDLQSLTYEQLSQLWCTMGGKQLPSVVYRVRLVAIQDVEPSAIQPPVTTIQTTFHVA